MLSKINANLSEINEHRIKLNENNADITGWHEKKRGNKSTTKSRRILNLFFNTIECGSTQNLSER